MESLASYNYSDDEEESANSSSSNKEEPNSLEDNYDTVGMDMSDDDDKSPDNQQYSASSRSSRSRSADEKVENGGGKSSQKQSISSTSSHSVQDEAHSRSSSRSEVGRWSSEGSRSKKSLSPRSRTRSPRSRSRSRSHSPKSRHSSHHHFRKRSDHTERYRDRNKDKDKDRERSPHRRSYDRIAANKMCILEKLGIELKVTEKDKDSLALNCFRDPLGQDASRFQEQIAKRKLLWRRNESKPTNSVVKKVELSQPNQNQWKDARFSHDQDGKLTAKFHRLMGMKASGESSSSCNTGRRDTSAIKKQEELFSTMEMQYEAARNATHKQRGVGLGFSSHHFTPR